MMMATRNVVHATFWLLEVMVATAGIYLLLSAEFLALVQVLVYAGAVAVLTLFTVMLTLRRREDAVREFPIAWGSMSIAALFTGAVLMVISAFEPVDRRHARVGSRPRGVRHGDVHDLGVAVRDRLARAARRACRRGVVDGG